MNSKYRIEICKPEHFYKIQARPYDNAMMFKDNGADKYISHYATSSFAFTAFYGDSIIAIGGILPIWPGAAEAWMFIGDDLAKHKRFIYKSVKNKIEDSFKFLNLQRLQMVCLTSYEKAGIFAEHLGFVKEGTMEKYTNGEAYDLYARVI